MKRAMIREEASFTLTTDGATAMKIIDSKKLTPDHAADTLVRTEDGRVCAAMFFRSSGAETYKSIAARNGFEVQMVKMIDELGRRHPLVRKWENSDGERVMTEWQPKIPEGWSLGEKFIFNYEDLVACVIRPKPLPGGRAVFKDGRWHRVVEVGDDRVPL